MILYIWTFLALMHHAPVERLPQWAGHEETPREAMARYGDIAADITAVCEDAKAPRSCAALLVAIAIGESGLARDADVGPCHRGGAHRTRCDSGAAYSLWQIHEHGDVTGVQLFADRRLAARVALRAARGSLRMCRHLPPGDQLAGLSGTCEPSARHMASARARYALWRRVDGWQVTP